jgi:3-phenylpropionate/cinnamic acid dioxygenase small subunit
MSIENPSQKSYYVSDEWYQSLVDGYQDWQHPEAEITDLNTRDLVRRLLEKEAYLLDETRLDDWLALYVPECAYWVPASLNQGDPRKEIAVCFDDRRRLEDRIFRLQNDFAWSQRPASRTARILSGITAYQSKYEEVIMVRSSFFTTEFHDGDWRKYTGWYGHRLRKSSENWRIEVKQVNLIDCDQNLRNLSVIL